MPKTEYEFKCPKTTCGYVWRASQVAGNNKCPKCGRQAHPKKVK